MNLDKAFESALADVSRDMATSATLPPDCYRDLDVLKAENTMVTHRSWIGVGRGDRWASPGDYSVLNLGGAPVIVMRGDDQRLRAFANTCRHRGPGRGRRGTGNPANGHVFSPRPPGSVVGARKRRGRVCRLVRGADAVGLKPDTRQFPPTA